MNKSLKSRNTNRSQSYFSAISHLVTGLGVLAMLALLGCGGGLDGSDLVSGTIRIVNTDNSKTITRVDIVGDCTNSWGSGTTVSIAPGASKDFTVDGDDSYDVRSCFSTSGTCAINFSVWVDIDDTTVVSHDDQGISMQGNC